MKIQGGLTVNEFVFNFICRCLLINHSFSVPLDLEVKDSVFKNLSLTIRFRVTIDIKSITMPGLLYKNMLITYVLNL